MSAAFKHWCETCEGVGTIDETLGGEHFSNPKANCPDCGGLGYWVPRARPDGGPAFPTLPEHGFNNGEPGMTLRDYFAAQALPGALMARADADGDFNPAAVAAAAYIAADAMLKARAS